MAALNRHAVDRPRHQLLTGLSSMNSDFLLEIIYRKRYKVLPRFLFCFVFFPKISRFKVILRKLWSQTPAQLQDDRPVALPVPKTTPWLGQPKEEHSTHWNTQPQVRPSAMAPAAPLPPSTELAASPFPAGPPHSGQHAAGPPGERGAGAPCPASPWLHCA